MSFWLTWVERWIRFFRFANRAFILSVTSIILLVFSLFTPLFSEMVVYGLNRLTLPHITETLKNERASQPVTAVGEDGTEADTKPENSDTDANTIDVNDANINALYDNADADSQGASTPETEIDTETDSKTDTNAEAKVGRTAEPSQKVGAAQTLSAQNAPITAYVVLGGGLTNDKQNRPVLNDYSLSRVETVAKAYERNPLPIILSGTEAPWMQAWLEAHGIYNIVSENASMNTCENARFTAKRLYVRHVYLVSDQYHMARARRQFALNGIATTPLPAPMPQPRDWYYPEYNLNHSRRAVYEVAAYLRDVIRPQSDCRDATSVSDEQLQTPRYTFIKTFD